jgi:hypothetical protein
MEYLRKMINDRLVILNGGEVVDEKDQKSKLQEDFEIVNQNTLTQVLVEGNIMEVILK